MLDARDATLGGFDEVRNVGLSGAGGHERVSVAKSVDLEVEIAEAELWHDLPASCGEFFHLGVGLRWDV